MESFRITGHIYEKLQYTTALRASNRDWEIYRMFSKLYSQKHWQQLHLIKHEC